MKRYIKSAEGLTSKQRQQIAKNSRDPKELARLAYDNADSVRRIVANNRSTPAKALAQLANDESEYVRMCVAENPNTPAKALAQLANDEDGDVRRYVAENPNTPADVLAQLANDEDRDVREYVAENPNTPADVLVQLANDENADVRRGVAQNPNAPADAVKPQQNNQTNQTRPSRKSPQSDWSVPLYSIQDYSQIEDEIDAVIDQAANEYAIKYLGGTADVYSPEGIYDTDGQIEIQFNTPDGQDVATIDVDDIIGPATSQNKKSNCVKALVKWFESNL